MAEGQGTEHWSDILPEGMRAWDEVKNAETVDKFWDQVTDMRSHLGSSIRVPGEGAGEQDWSTFHEKLTKKVPQLIFKPDFKDEEASKKFYGSLGRPDKAEDYTLPTFDREDVDTKAAELFKLVAHDVGLNQKQYNTIVSVLTKADLLKQDESAGVLKADKLALATAWGDALQQNKGIVDSLAVKTDAPDTLVNALEKGQVDALMMQWLHKVATKIAPESLNLGEDHSQGKVQMTPQEAGLKIAEIRRNKEHPYWHKMDPGHQIARKEMRDLYKAKDPDNWSKPAPGSGFGSTQ